MRITDIIRDILELIDNEREPVDVAHEQEEEIAQQDDLTRFKQLAGIEAHNPDAEYSNEPHPTMTGIEAVTTDAGGGWNGPKHPADIRGDSIRIYGGN